MPHAPCPRLESSISHAAFWRKVHAEPQPYIIPGAAAADFVAEYGRQQLNGDTLFEFGLLGPSSQRYTLSNPGGGEHVANVFAALPHRFPLPLPLRSIDLTPMVSVGLNGTGQTDLARHYHGVTAMRLLQGRKIWALRPPDDPECRANSGECTDPFDVRARHGFELRSRGSPLPLPPPLLLPLATAADELGACVPAPLAGVRLLRAAGGARASVRAARRRHDCHPRRVARDVQRGR